MGHKAGDDAVEERALVAHGLVINAVLTCAELTEIFGGSASGDQGMSCG